MLEKNDGGSTATNLKWNAGPSSTKSHPRLLCKEVAFKIKTLNYRLLQKKKN